MKYSCKLELPIQLYEALQPEISQAPSLRAEWGISKTTRHTMVTIRAEDATALRALLTSITKLLSVWEAVD